MFRLPPLRAVAALCLVAGLGGCIASAVVDVATAPVRVAGKAVDLATTSQSEADEKRGRAMRQQEEQLGRLDREYRKQSRRCREGDEDACDRAEETAEEIETLERRRD